MRAPADPFRRCALGLPVLVVLLLSESAGCSGPKRLKTSVGGHPAESLRAEARKIGGRWQVELLLPAGSWRVEPEEGQTIHLIPGEPRSTLRWVVDPERWSQQDRPFRFTLIGEGGLRLPMSVRYPNVLPHSVTVILQALWGHAALSS